jgi:hypothetical protein
MGLKEEMAGKSQVGAVDLVSGVGQALGIFAGYVT